MKIKYGDLPPRSVCEKLISVSFDTPQKNLAVFKFFNVVSLHLLYIENENMKLFQKHGVPDNDNPDIYRIPPYKEKNYKDDLDRILSMEIEEEIQMLPLCEEDFVDDRCQYSVDKRKWLSGADIAAVLAFCKK